MEQGTGLIILGSAIGSAKLVEKILGPTAEYLGEGLKEFTEKSINNIKRIFVNAKEKLGDRIDQPGRVSPKVLKGILQEGSFCEDELSAEYFGGVLASSKSNIIRDDRGAAFIALLSRLTTYQIRSHFIFYHVIKQLFNGENLKPNFPEDRIAMETFISINEYIEGMEFSEKENQGEIFVHVMNGLEREFLIEPIFHSGPARRLTEFWKDVKEPGIIFTPSAYGVELFMWGYGYGAVHISKFLNTNIKFPLEAKISIPKNAVRIGKE